MSLLEDGLSGKMREGVLFVMEGGGKVEGGSWRREGGGGEFSIIVH